LNGRCANSRLSQPRGSPHRIVPRTVPTLYRARLFHRVKNRVLLRVNVALRDVHVAVSSQVGKRPRIHVRCPPGEAGMPERVQLEARWDRMSPLEASVARFETCHFRATAHRESFSSLLYP
jgi:hypothetical protein